jgi:predicted nucleic acid-binding protein
VTGPRRPSDILVVDANILLGAILGRSRPLIYRVGQRRHLLTSEDVIREVFSALASFGARRDWLAVAEALLAFVIPQAPDRQGVAVAGTMLTRAVASRNGSASDAHLLAVAWAHDADIWSHDRDFAGTGWPSWSSANLMAALSEPAAGQAS